MAYLGTKPPKYLAITTSSPASQYLTQHMYVYTYTCTYIHLPQTLVDSPIQPLGNLIYNFQPDDPPKS